MQNSNTATASTLTLSATGGTTTFSGNIAGGSGLGTLSLVMSGSGVQVLAGTNTYTGGTDVTGGTLDFAGPAATPSTGIIAVEPGGYVVLGALLGASSPSAASGETEPVQTPADGGSVAATSGNASDARLTLPLGDDAAGGTAASAGTASVPEPAAMVLLLAGAAALAAAAWRRRAATRGHSTFHP